MATSNSGAIIADSSGIISLFNTTDINHKIALKISRKVVEKYGMIIVPGEIFTEIVNTIGKKFSHNDAVKAGKLLLQTEEFTLVGTSEETRQLAFEKFQKQPASVSFTDCLVMAFADEYKTKDIFGFDESFKKSSYLRLGIDMTVV